MIKKLFVLFLLAGAAAGGYALFKYFSRPQGLILTGIVTTHEVNVSPQIQGRLIQLLVKEGDQVQAGQLLARIDPRELKADQDYYSRGRQSASAQVQVGEAALRFQEQQTREQIRQAEAALEATRAKLEEANANLQLARTNHARTRELVKRQVYAGQTLDQVQSALDAAQAEVESIKKQVDAQNAALALARTNEKQTAVLQNQWLSEKGQLAAAGEQVKKAGVRLDYTEIHAPISGVVSVLDSREGEVVNAASPILTLINPDDLWVRADVAETYIDRIRTGDSLAIRLPSGAELKGTVFLRRADADYATQRDTNDIKRDIKTFEIRLRVDNSERRLWPGLTAYIQLPVELTAEAR